MPLVDFALVKRHCRVPHDEDDLELAVYQAAAEGIVAAYVDRTVLPTGSTLPVPEDDGYDEYTMLVTPAIVAAILLLTSDFYEVREPDPKLDGDAVLPRPVRALLAPWRVWRTLPDGEHISD